MSEWGKLWDIATGEPGDPAVIEVDAEDVGTVVLCWPDGSRRAFTYHDGDWQGDEDLNTVPGDVAARDTL